MPQEFKSDFQMKCTKSAVPVEFKLTRIEVRGNEFKLTSIISRFPIFDHTHTSVAVLDALLISVTDALSTHAQTRTRRFTLWLGSRSGPTLICTSAAHARLASLARHLSHTRSRRDALSVQATPSLSASLPLLASLQLTPRPALAPHARRSLLARSLLLARCSSFGAPRSPLLARPSVPRLCSKDSSGEMERG